MRGVLRGIGGIIGLALLGMVVWDILDTHALSEYGVSGLPVGIMLVVYAIGGEAFLSKVAPSLTRTIWSTTSRNPKEGRSRFLRRMSKIGLILLGIFLILSLVGVARSWQRSQRVANSPEGRALAMGTALVADMKLFLKQEDSNTPQVQQHLQTWLSELYVSRSQRNVRYIFILNRAGDVLAHTFSPDNAVPSWLVTLHPLDGEQHCTVFKTTEDHMAYVDCAFPEKGHDDTAFIVRVGVIRERQ